MLNATFDLFIFDFDGTIADSRLNIVNSLNFALQNMKLTPIHSSVVHPLIGKLSLYDTFMHFYPSITLQQSQKLVSDFRQYQRDNLTRELDLYPDAIKTLQQLRDKDKYLAILTTKNIEQMEYILGQLNLHRFFHVVCGEGLLQQNKPDKACIEYIWSSLPSKVEQERSVIVGDSVVDILSAQNAGIEMIAVGYGVDSPEYLLSEGASYTVQSLSELLNFM